jgi:hypothetical protein
MICCMKFPDSNTFGVIPIPPDRLVRQLESMRFRNKGRFWPKTKPLFEFMKRECCGGSKHNNHFMYQSKHPKKHEFQVDFLWFSGGSARRVLAVESEWNARRIQDLQHDFEKLLYFKSALKLMIVNECAGLAAGKIAEGLSKYVEDLPIARDEIVLLFVFCKKGVRKAYYYIGDGGSHFQFKEFDEPRKAKAATAPK